MKLRLLNAVALTIWWWICWGWAPLAVLAVIQTVIGNPGRGGRDSITRYVPAPAPKKPKRRGRK